jgi:hypothetical protein
VVGFTSHNIVKTEKPELKAETGEEIK